MSFKQPQRDGFIVKSFDTDEELRFFPCTRNGERRENSYDHFLTRINLEECYMVDTRVDGDSDG